MAFPRLVSCLLYLACAVEGLGADTKGSLGATQVTVVRPLDAEDNGVAVVRRSLVRELWPGKVPWKEGPSKDGRVGAGKRTQERAARGVASRTILPDGRFEQHPEAAQFTASRAELPQIGVGSADERGQRIISDPFQTVTDKLKAYSESTATTSFLFGNRDGRLFEYSSSLGYKYLPMSGRSLSKWTTTVAIAGAIAKGHLAFETRANECFSWWTKDPDDPRSHINLRHLLTMSSGYTYPGYNHDRTKQTCLNTDTNPATWFYPITSCARQIYDTANYTGIPFKTWDYNDWQPHIALAMALTKTGFTWCPACFFFRYLNIPAGMPFAFYSGFPFNPLAAGGIIVTRNALESFVQKYLNNELLPEDIQLQLDTEYTYPNNMKRNKWSMTYGMGHEVRTSQAGVDFGYEFQFLGAEGLRILVDRVRGVYMIQMQAVNPGTQWPMDIVFLDVYAAMGITPR